MDHETNTQTNHQFRRLPKGERRVRFADSMGIELVSIFLIDLISNYYFASIHNHKQLPPPPKQASIIYNHKPPPPATSLHSNHQHNNNNNNHLSTEKSNRCASSLATSHQESKPCLQRPTSTTSTCNKNQQLVTYVPEFGQPICLISFKERVRLNKVHLETCDINSTAGHVSVSCTIRVLNLSYEKSVIVRYTTDEWHTYTDSLASYKPGSCDGWSDRFTSTFTVTQQVKQFQTGQRILFAIRYTCDGDKVFWDSNGGLNYSIKKK